MVSPRQILLVVAALAACTALAPAKARAGDVPARARAAFHALQQGDGARAESESALAVEEQATSAGAWSVRGYILSARGDKSAATDAYRQAVRLDPNDPVARNNLGAVLLDRGLVQPSIIAFRNALRLRPLYADARNNLGAAFEKQGRMADARTAYRAATVIDPKHAEAHNNLGVVHLKSGDVRAASASFARAAALDDQFAAPALNLALVGDPDEGDAALIERLMAAARKPGAPAALKARVLAIRAGREADALRWDASRDLYLTALKLTPRDTTLLNNVAVVEDQLGLDREAILHLTDALDINPELRVAQNNIGIVHVHRGQMEQAKGVFQALLAEDPRFHRAHYNLGVVQASEGRIKDARASFSRASRLAPRDANVRYNLAILNRQGGGNLREELRAYREVLRLDPKLVEAHLALGMLLADPSTPASLRDGAAARRHLRTFLELAPKSDDEGRTQAREWLAWLDADS